MSVHQLKADRVIPIQEIKHIYIYIYTHTHTHTLHIYIWSMGLSLKWIWLEFVKFGDEYGAPELRMLAVVCRGRLSGFYNPLFLKLMSLRYNFYVVKWGHCSVFSLICFDKYPVQPSLLPRCGMISSLQKDLYSPSRQCPLRHLRQPLSCFVIMVFVSFVHSRIPATWNHTICLFGGCHRSPTMLCVSVVSFYWC